MTSRRGPRNYQRSDDLIRDDICERPDDDPMIDASEIEVRVEKREVTLSGTVRDRRERRRAEDLAESISTSHMCRTTCGPASTRQGIRPELEVGDFGATTGNPGIGTAGVTAGSAAGDARRVDPEKNAKAAIVRTAGLLIRSSTLPGTDRGDAGVIAGRPPK